MWNAIARAVSPSLGRCEPSCVERALIDVALARARPLSYLRAPEPDDSVLPQPAWVERERLLHGAPPHEVDPGEPGAANVLRLGDTLIMPAGLPRTVQRLLDTGFKVIVMSVSELAKAKSAVTCCSLVFPSYP